MMPTFQSVASKELYEQGVPFSELKALIPDIRGTRGAITYQADAREQQ